MITNTSELRARIMQESEHHLTPQDVAQAVLAGLSAKELRVIAEAALPGYAQRVMTEPLRAVTKAPQAERVNNKPAARNGQVKTYAAANGKRFPSPALAARYDWYERQLSVSLMVDGERKRFGDLGVADLGWLVRYREQQAEELHAKAKRFQKIAELLESEGATTVRDLDPALVEPLLGD